MKACSTAKANANQCESRAASSMAADSAGTNQLRTIENDAIASVWVKGLFHLKMKILSSFTQVVANLYEFPSSAEHNLVAPLTAQSILILGHHIVMLLTMRMNPMNMAPFKGLVHPKMKIKSLIIHPHAVPTP